MCLLLDEPFEGIVPIIIEQMAETMLKIMAKGLTVILSEQNLHSARIVVDRVIIIESGKKRFDDTFAELDSDPSIQQAYLLV